MELAVCHFQPSGGIAADTAFHHFISAFAHAGMQVCSCSGYIDLDPQQVLAQKVTTLAQQTSPPNHPCAPLAPGPALGS